MLQAFARINAKTPKRRQKLGIEKGILLSKVKCYVWIWACGGRGGGGGGFNTCRLKSKDNTRHNTTQHKK